MSNQENVPRKPFFVWRALRHFPLTPNERVVYTWLKTILFFLLSYVLSYLVDAMVNNRNLGSWNVYQGLLIGLGYLILASIYKYFMATSQEQAGIIIGRAVAELEPRAEKEGHVLPPDVVDVPYPPRIPVLPKEEPPPSSPPSEGRLPC